MERYEDSKNMQSVTFKFHDDDSLSYSIFDEVKSQSVMNILNSKITKGLLILISLLHVVAYIRYGIINLFTQIYGSLTSLLFSLYIMGLILIANKNALKLCPYEFTIWFKMYYLLIYVVAHSWYNNRTHFGVSHLIFICCYDLYS